MKHCTRAAALTVAAVALVALSGCGDLLSTLTGLLGDSTSDASAMAAIAGTWTVTAYSGTSSGTVTVPSADNMVWTFSSGGTYTLTSAQPVAVGSTTETYNEAGAWNVPLVDTMTISPTQHLGVSIPAASQVIVTAIYSEPDSSDLVIQTSAIGPGTVRYVLSR